MGDEERADHPLNCQTPKNHKILEHTSMSSLEISHHMITKAMMCKNDNDFCLPLDIVVAKVGENEGLDDFREEDHYRPKPIS